MFHKNMGSLSSKGINFKMNDIQIKEIEIYKEISLESYQDIKFPELDFDEICQRSNGGRVNHIKLMKKHIIRESRVFQFPKSFKTLLLISSC